MSNLLNSQHPIEQLVALKAKYLPATNTQELLQDFYARLNESKPRVMMFGSYNAGKSSLINALLAEDKAKIADVPTTDQIDRYEWQHASLFDTPGINAPIQHEEVTIEQLNRIELVLFVIRSSDQDTKSIYERMFNLIERGKQLFIVLNYEKEEDVVLESEKLNQTMLQYAGKRNISTAQIGRIPTLKVNIKTALKGQKENKQALVEHSGFNQFQMRFKQWLQEFDNSETQQQHLEKFVLQSVVQPTLAVLEAQLNGEEGSALDELQYQRAQIIKKYENLAVGIRTELRAQCNQSKTGISKLLTNPNSAEIDSGLQNLANEIANNASQILQQKCNEIEQGLQVSVTGEAVRKLDLSGKSEETSIFSVLAGRAVDALKSEEATKPIIKQGLMWLRSQGLKPFKGKWEKTLTRWAGASAKKLNVLVQVGTSVYELYAANEEQNKLNKEQREASLSLYQITDEVSSDIFNAINTDAQSLINQAKENSLIAIDQEINRQIALLDEQQKDQQSLLLLAQEISA
ncbi:MAG: GTPase [Venatoribacter sp.]